MSGDDTDEQLSKLATELARSRGGSLFADLARLLAELLGAEEARICEITGPGRARTLGAWRMGAIVANFDYDLAGTPCADVLTGQTIAGALDATRFPAVRPGYRGYFGMPLTANDGGALGHLCALAERPLMPSPRTRSLIDISAGRAAAELRLTHVKRERAMLRAQRRRLLAELAANRGIEALTGVSEAHQRLLDEVQRVAPAAASVLITGEPGTGTECIARAIHSASPRAAKPFVVIDCAALSIAEELDALPETLRLADGGTLYLDELGALSREYQARLLSIIAGRRQGNGPDVRLIASSHRDLQGAVARQEFLDALLFELAMFPIRVLPLRARVEDIAALVDAFAHKHARRFSRDVSSIDPDSLAELQRYAWPGNVRELDYVVERAVLTSEGPVLKIATDLLAPTTTSERAALVASTGSTIPPGVATLDDSMETGLHAVQREHILRVLNATHWIIEGPAGAAVKLQLKPATLRHRMKKLGITRALNQPGRVHH